MQTLKMPLKVLRHDHFPPRDANDRESFMIEAGYEVGVPAVKLYLTGEQAAQLKHHTGHGFRRDEQDGKRLEPYNIVGEFAPFTSNRRFAAKTANATASRTTWPSASLASRSVRPPDLQRARQGVPAGLPLLAKDGPTPKPS